MNKLFYILSLLLVGCALQPVEMEEDMLMREADRLLEAEQYDSALALYSKIISNFSYSTVIDEAYRKGGECYKEKADTCTDSLLRITYLQDGLNLLDQVYSKGDEFVKSLVEKGEVFTLLNSYDSAAHYFTSVVAQYPQHSRADNAMLGLGYLSVIREQSDSAKEWFERIIAEYPNGNSVGTAWYELGVIALNTGYDTLTEQIISLDDIQEAKENFSKVDSTSKSWDNAQFDLGFVYYIQNMYDSSLYYHTTIFEQMPTSSKADNAVLYIGHVNRKLGILDSAQVWYELVIENYPFSGAYDNALYWAGDYYYDRREIDDSYQEKAIDLLSRFIEIADPTDDKYGKAVRKLAKMGVVV